MSSVQQKQLMDEALLEEAPIPKGSEEASPSLQMIVGFAFLTFNSGMAIYQGNRDWGAISVLSFSFFTLILLFHCLRLHAKAAPGSPRREHLKMAMWLLTTMLTIAFFSLLYYFFSPNTGDIGAESGSAHDPQTHYQPSIP